MLGTGVRAKVLDIDTVHNRLSLGLKASYFDSNIDTDGSATEVMLPQCRPCLTNDSVPVAEISEGYLHQTAGA